MEMLSDSTLHHSKVFQLYLCTYFSHNCEKILHFTLQSYTKMSALLIKHIQVDTFMWKYLQLQYYMVKIFSGEGEHAPNPLAIACFAWEMCFRYLHPRDYSTRAESLQNTWFNSQLCLKSWRQEKKFHDLTYI